MNAPTLPQGRRSEAVHRSKAPRGGAPLSDDAANAARVAPQKYRPARQLLPLVIRTALLDRLGRDASDGLVFVVAPAGFGKSVLLGQWMDRRLAAGEATAWLTLDEGDRDERCLAQALAAAIRQPNTHSPDCATLPAIATLADLERALSRSTGAEPLFLFLDRFDRIAGSPAATAIARLAEMSIDRVHWTIATRPPGDSAFGGLWAQGRVHIIDDHALRLDPKEAATLLDRRLARAEKNRLETALRGWPIAVQALREELCAGGTMAETLDRLDGAQGMIGDYITAELISSLEPPLIDFLTDVSILPEIDPGSADLVRENGDSHRLIREMDVLGSLVDVQPGGGRKLVPLLQTAFEAKFERRPGTTGVARRQAVAKLLASRQDYLGAVANLRLAGRSRDAVELIERTGIVRLWVRFGLAYLLDVLSMLPTSIAAEYPALQVGEALRLLYEGHMRSAAMLIGQIRAEAGGISNPGRTKLEDELTGVEIILTLSRDIMTEDQLEKFQLLSDEGMTDELSIEVSSLAIVAYQQWGEFDRAARLVPLCRQNTVRFGSQFNEFFLEIYLGWLAQAQGHPQKAIDHYRRALEIQVGGERLRCLSEVMIAEALHTLGDFDGAAAQLEKWLPKLERSVAWFDFFAAGYCTAAAVTFQREGLIAALASVERAWIVALERQSTAMVRLLRPLKLSLLMRGGNWKAARAYETAEQIVAQCDALPDDPRLSAWRERDLLRTAAAEFHLKTGNLADARRCIERLLQEAPGSKRAAAVQAAGLLRAALLWRQGARRQAITLLASVIEDALASRLTGPLFERLHLIEPLLGPLHESGQLKRAAARQWVEIAARNAAARASGRSETLTAREQEILSLIRGGDRNKTIARRLGISVNTVKFHLKRIAAKLDAKGSGRAILARSALEAASE
jgi:LuxR family maltose regulon positive regulatory protein